MATQSPRGIGGWLVVFIILQIIGALAAGFSLLEIQTSQQELQEFYRLVPSAESIVQGEALFQGFRIVAAFFGLILIFGRSRRAPMFWRIVLVLTIIGAIADFLAGDILVAEVREAFQPAVADAVAQELERSGIQNIVGGFFAFLWLFYWLSSDRVRNTFLKDEAQSDPRDAEIVATFGSAPGTPPLPEDPGPADYLAQVAPPPPDPFRGRPTRECPHCGERVLTTAEFCRGCKQPIGGATPSPTPVPVAGAAPAPTPPDESPPDPPAPEEPSSL